MKDKEYIAQPYITGILPIKKYCSNNELNMFSDCPYPGWPPIEYSMTDPEKYARFIGFIQGKVKIFEKFNIELNSMIKWLVWWIFFWWRFSYL